MPAPARTLAFDILLRVEAGAYASDLLAAHTAGLDSRDAGLAEQIVFGVLRYRAQLDYLIEHYSGRRQKLDGEVRTALRMAVYQLRYLERIPAHAAVAVDEASGDALVGTIGGVDSQGHDVAGRVRILDGRRGVVLRMVVVGQSPVVVAVDGRYGRIIVGTRDTTAETPAPTGRVLVLDARSGRILRTRPSAVPLRTVPAPRARFLCDLRPSDARLQL